MNSMTGFGRGTIIAGGRRLVVEVRSVNHRGIDVKVRARDLEGSCEIEVVKAVRAAIERGAVVVSVREEGGLPVAVDPDRIRAMFTSLERLREELGVPGPVDLRTVAAFLGEAGGPGSEAPLTSWEALAPALGQALAALGAMRAEEGRALAVDLRARLERLRRTVAAIASAASSLPTRASRRLEERLATLTLTAQAVAVDPARLAQEIALLAERLDVSEELVRLETHLAHLQRLVDGADQAAAGRKMDFVVQEIGRELNTVGAKVQDAEIAALVIDAKAELEKIREQAQNVE
jgi:uncharacterized protein YicC (UPF0701 family)